MTMKPDDYEDSVMTDIAENCSNVVKAEETKYQTDENTSKCSPIALIAMKCAHIGMADACPDDLKVNSEKCTKPPRV